MGRDTSRPPGNLRIGILAGSQERWHRCHSHPLDDLILSGLQCGQQPGLDRTARHPAARQNQLLQFGVAVRGPVDADEIDRSLRRIELFERQASGFPGLRRGFLLDQGEREGRDAGAVLAARQSARSPAAEPAAEKRQTIVRAAGGADRTTPCHASRRRTR